MRVSEEGRRVSEEGVVGMFGHSWMSFTCILIQI